MYEDMLFSLSYEQMTQMAEEEIKRSHEPGIGNCGGRAG
ncbi:Uncharacterised protein [Klebsiella pneumoniae]|nr:Uncharacterised protein [Klebsiella pneumoniae]